MKKLLSTKVKDMNAITLIALVITIVVLIILAAVAINLSLGNNGIFNRAKTAKEQYQNATQYEETEVAKASNRIDNYVGNNRDYATISYSTDEQDTGIRWIDGKKIYQKSLKMASSYTSEVSISSGAGVAVTGITDVYMETIKPVLHEVIETTMQNNNSSSKHHQYAHRLDFNNGYVCAYDNYNVGYINFALYPGTVITIKYTKTTD